MIDKEMVKAELQNIQKYFEAKMDMTIGDGKLKMACWARTCRDALELLTVRHGRWLEGKDRWGEDPYQCSECGEEWWLNDGTPAENNMNFCPRCGADMREGEKDD